MIRKLICTGLIAAAAPLAWAQSASSASAPAATALPSTPAKKELAARILTLQQQGIDGIARALAEQPVQRMMQAAAQALPQLAPEKRESASKAIDADVRKYFDETIPYIRERANKLAPTTIGPMLEEKFTEDELKQIAAWLDSPVNKKYQQVAPEMQNAFAQKLIAETRGTIEPKLKSLEERVSSDLGIVRPAAAAGSATSASKPASSPAKAKP